MIDERSRRRSTFHEGTAIQLADGQRWWLPAVGQSDSDPVLEMLRRAIVSAREEHQRQRDELSLTILLLSRNYQLSPELYPQLLGFRPADPARAELQRAIRRLAQAPDASPRVELVANVDRKPGPSRRWGLSAATRTLSRVRSRWTARSQ